MVEKITNAKRFRDYLVNFFAANPNKSVEFSATYDGWLDTDSEDFESLPLNTRYFSDWYFARIVDLNDLGHTSRFILIDSCGGENAFAIPLNNYSTKFDEDDERIIYDRLCEWFWGENATEVFIEKIFGI